MSLVSSMYRMASSEWVGSPDERLVRTTKAIRRLVGRYGVEHVRSAIESYGETDLETAVVKKTLLSATEKCQ